MNNFSEQELRELIQAEQQEALSCIPSLKTDLRDDFLEACCDYKSLNHLLIKLIFDNYKRKRPWRLCLIVNCINILRYMYLQEECSK